MAYEPSLGARIHAGRTRFRLWSDRVGSASVRIYDLAGGVVRTEAMIPEGGGFFSGELSEVGSGSLYKFVLDGNEAADPYARSLPQGVGGPAAVLDLGDRSDRLRGPEHPLEAIVIYELHVGSFTPEGTYEAAIPRLRAVAELGVTAIELMPIGAFAGRWGWGYDGVAHFAPHAAYGTPEELLSFIDAAHDLGLSVILDVVYNHFGPAGNVLHQYSSAYFTRDHASPWGEAPNFHHPAMRRYVLENVRYWLETFGFDGLRLDATQAIVDRSEIHILAEIAQVAKSVAPAKILFAEDDRNDPDLVDRYGLDALWADDFHHVVHVALTGERDGYYASYDGDVETLAKTIDRGWLYQGEIYPAWGRPRGRPATGLEAAQLVCCIQNHDQIGNRALGERITTQTSIDAFCTVSTLLLFLPMTPLLFMGQEWAASSPFLYFTDHGPELGRVVSEGRLEEFKKFRAFSDPKARSKIPDPQDERTFLASKLIWTERDIPEHRRVLATYRAMLELRRSDEVLRSSRRSELIVEATGGLLSVVRRHGEQLRLLIANLTAEPAPLSPQAHRLERWTPMFSTAPLDDPRTLPAQAAALFSASTRDRVHAAGTDSPRSLDQAGPRRDR